MSNLKMQDGKYVEHGCTQDKVLGYNYNPENDSMQLAMVQINEN